MAVAAIPRGPRGHLLTGNLPEFRRDRLGFLEDCARRYGDFVPLRFPAGRGLLLNHPDYIEQVLVTSSRNFVKSLPYRLLRPVAGNGLLMSEGEVWKRQRRLAQPAFGRHRILEAYGPMMVDYTEQMLAGWRAGTEREMHAEMMRLTARIAAKSFFDAEVSDTTSDVGMAIQVMNEQLTARLDSVWVLLPYFAPTPGNLRVRRAVRRLDRVIYRIIAQRRREGSPAADLLSVLLSAQDEDGSRMSDTQLRDEVMTFFLAGHDTTALALTWTWYLLDQHAEVEARLWQELDEVLDTRPPTVADLSGLRYTEMVITEAMRVYPPVYALGREPIQDCEIGGFPVAAGTSIVFLPWLLHRDGRYFDEPERFWPDRWADGLARRLPRFAYFPFGGGQRMCIGASFAMTEATLLLAAVAQRFRLRVRPGHVVEPWPAFSLRPRRGLPMIVSPR